MKTIKLRAILKKMYEDEGEHANWAENDSSGNEVKEELSKIRKTCYGGYVKSND